MEEEEEEEVNKPSDVEFEISKINRSPYTNINLNSKPSKSDIAVYSKIYIDRVHLKIFVRGQQNYNKKPTLY